MKKHYTHRMCYALPSDILLSRMNTEYDQADRKARELADAQRTIEEYLRQEQRQEQQKKRKRNDLE